VKPEGQQFVKGTEVIQYGTKEGTIGKNEIDNVALTASTLVETISKLIFLEGSFFLCKYSK